MNAETILSKEFMKLANGNSKIIAVLLFGSYARGEPNRDIDICIVLDKKQNNIEMSKIKLKFQSVSESKFDVQVFQQLPIYIRKRILKEGKILFCKDYEKIYEIAFDTIKEFGYYKKIYETYLGSVK